MRWLALFLGTACVSTSTVSAGRSTSAVATVGFEHHDMVVRPQEVHWAVSGSLSHSEAIASTEVSGGYTAGGIFYGGPDAHKALPPVVQLAATRAITEADADGALITHYLVQTVHHNGTVTYQVQLVGRLLALTDLGRMSGERADEVDLLRVRYLMARENLSDDD